MTGRKWQEKSRKDGETNKDALLFRASLGAATALNKDSSNKEALTKDKEATARNTPDGFI